MELAIGKDLLHSYVKLSHVVFPKTVVVPADAFEERDVVQGHVEACLPLRVQALVDGGRRLPRVPQCDDQILELSDELDRSDILTGSDKPDLSFGARSRPWTVSSNTHCGVRSYPEDIDLEYQRLDIVETALAGRSLSSAGFCRGPALLQTMADAVGEG